MLQVQIDLEGSGIKCSSDGGLGDTSKAPTLTFFSLKFSSVLQYKQLWKKIFYFSGLKQLHKTDTQEYRFALYLFAVHAHDSFVD